MDQVTLDRPAGEILVNLACEPDQPWACPECHQAMHVHSYERRRWRHLDSCQYKTILEADVPREINGARRVTS